MKRDFLSLRDIKGEGEKIIQAAEVLKKRRREGKRKEKFLNSTHWGLLFEKPSTRTRVSFQVGIKELGGETIYLPGTDTQLQRGESLADTARVLSRYLDGLVVRTYSQERLEELAKYASIPIINALTDLLHPCQILSDLFTIRERKGGWEGVRIVYLGDGNNVCNSWIIASEIFQLDLVVSTPSSYSPPLSVLKEKGLITQKPILIEDPREAVKDAEVIYTDVWVSMGDGEKQEELFYPYQVNSSLLELARADCLVMHCLPAHRGKEITGEVMEGSHSLVWEQAENRLHVGKAILLWVTGKLEEVLS